MASFLSTLFLGLIAAAVGAFLQHALWKHKAIEEIRSREFDAAFEIVDLLGKAIDSRIDAQRRFKQLIDHGTASDADFKEFSLARSNWMNQFSSFKSKIFLYFGRQEMLRFENEIHALLYKTAEIIFRSYKLGLKNLSDRDAQEDREVMNRMDYTRYSAVAFLNDLNERVANYNFGTIYLYNNVSVGDLSKISRTYLIQRLFGLKS